MQIFLIGLIIAAGMGLSVEAGILGPLGQLVGDLWATLSIFTIGAVLTYLLVLFFAPRQAVTYSTRPAWELLGGVLGPVYVVVLTLATPMIGVALTMIAVLAGQVAQSLLIDHFAWFAVQKRVVDRYRIIALALIIFAIGLLFGVSSS